MARFVRCRAGMNAATAESSTELVTTFCERDAPVAPGTARHRLGFSPQALLILLGALGLLSTSRAEACTGWYDHNVPRAYATVPANGGAMVTLTCKRGTSGCAWPEPITVLREGVEVPGTFIHHGEDYTFIPAEPLEVGAVYTVPEFGEVTAVEAVPVDLASLGVGTSLHPVSTKEASESVCCEEARDSCGVYPCWSTSESERTVVGFELDVNIDYGALETTRTELRFAWTTSDGDSGQTEWIRDSRVRHVIKVANDSYCATPELRSLLTGETLTLDEVCFEHGDLPNLGDKEVVPPSIDLADLSVCPVPVEGYEEQWCTQVRPLCDAAEPFCARVADYCPEVEAGSGGGSGASPGGDGGLGGSDPDANEDAGDDGVGGGLCAVRAPGHVGGSAWAWATLGVLLAIGTRRRATQR